MAAPALSDPVFSWKADLLSLLATFAFELGVWARARAASREPQQFDAQVEWENHTRGLLANCDAVEACSQSDDPEIRSMAYQVQAYCPADPSLVAPELTERLEHETDDVARACLAEALVRAAHRGGARVDAGIDEDWIMRRLTDSSAVVRYRTARALGSDAPPAVAARVARILSTDQTAKTRHWLAES